MELENSLKACLLNDQEPFRICIPRWFGASQCFEYQFRFSKKDPSLGVLKVKSLPYDNKMQALTTKDELSTTNPFSIHKISNDCLALVIEKLHVHVKGDAKSNGPPPVYFTRPKLIHCFQDSKRPGVWDMQCSAEVAQNFFTLNNFDSQFGLLALLVNGLVDIRFSPGHMTLNMDLNVRLFRIPYLKSQEVQIMPPAPSEPEEYDLESGKSQI